MSEIQNLFRKVRKEETDFVLGLDHTEQRELELDGLDHTYALVTTRVWVSPHIRVESPYTAEPVRVGADFAIGRVCIFGLGLPTRQLLPSNR